MVESKDIDIVLGFVSVPYRGATFLNEAGNIQLLCTDKFPSPIGELHFSMHYKVTDAIKWKKVSVPYRGATFLNTIPATPCPVWDE